MKRMRRGGLVALILALLATAAWSKDAESERQVLQRHKAFLAATARGDAKAMAELIADDYVITGVDGRVADRAKSLEAVKQNGPQGAQNGAQVSITEDDVKVRMLGDAGVVTGVMQWKVGSGAYEQRGFIRFTEVWAKQRDGRWVLSVAHATALPLGSEKGQ